MEISMKKYLSIIILTMTTLAFTLSVNAMAYNSYLYLPVKVNNVFAMISAVIFGYILPIVMFVLGLRLPKTKKYGYMKRWYALSVLAVIWILLSTAILIIALV